MLGFGAVNSVAKEMHNGIKLIGIKSFPRIKSGIHKTKSCIFLISLAAHQQLEKGVGKARNSNGSQYKTLLPTSPYSQKASKLDVDYTYPRFSQTTTALTVCKVTPLDTYSRKDQRGYERISFPR